MHNITLYHCDDAVPPDTLNILFNFLSCSHSFVEFSVALHQVAVECVFELHLSTMWMFCDFSCLVNMCVSLKIALMVTQTQAWAQWFFPLISRLTNAQSSPPLVCTHTLTHKLLHCSNEGWLRPPRNNQPPLYPWERRGGVRERERWGEMVKKRGKAQSEKEMEDEDHEWKKTEI